MTGTDTSVAPLSAADTRGALDQDAVARWWQVTGVLEVAGPDAASLLDGICTQAVPRIEPGHAGLGLFLDAKAKIIAPAIVHRLPDAPWVNDRRPAEPVQAPRFALETLPTLIEPLRAHVTRYRLRAQATVTASALATVALVGPEAAAVAAATRAGESGAWTIVEDQFAPTHAFLGTAEACQRVVRELAPRLADPAEFEAQRITAGVAGLHDLLVGRMPAEVGGMAGVALDAGCYLGQEPVVRLHFRGRPNRTLRRLDAPGVLAPAPPESPDGFDETHDPDAAFALVRAAAPDRVVGRLTTWSTREDGTTVALAMVRREVEDGEALFLPGTAGSLRVLDPAPATS